jgi:16S rRNA (cytosine967-C5)-methyltransferase
LPVSSARTAAFDILFQVDREHAYAAELLHSSQFHNLSQPDHALATELVMGVLRWRSLLDQEIAKASSLPLQKLDIEVLTALRLAAYQMLLLDRVPARAAVNESVELVKRSHKRSAVPFANAVLRKLSVRLPAMKDELFSSRAESISEMADCCSHPRWLVDRWRHQYGDAIAKQICEYDQQIPETSIRLTDSSVEAELQREGIQLATGKLLTSARRIQSGELTATVTFRKGLVNIQDEASQLVALLVGRASTIFDCCAAPGGKTRIISERNSNAKILAMDLHPHRARLLRKLVPAKNVGVISADALHPPIRALFERVLVDVPCSGTGTLARNPEIKWRLTIEDINDLQARQVGVLQSAMRCVAPGGRLIYSTCSLEREENAHVIEKALAANESVRILNCLEVLEDLRREGELALTDESLDSMISGPFLRTIPGIHPCDGFFAAVLEKSSVD